MARQLHNSPLLGSNDGNRIVGLKGPNGDEVYFSGLMGRGRILGQDGDSLTAYGVAGTSGGQGFSGHPVGISNRSYWQWANIELGGVIEFGPNTGIAGDDTRNLLARWFTYGPGRWGRDVDVISINIGYNNFKNGYTNAETQADLIEIWTRALEFNKPVVVFTLTTPTSASTLTYPYRFRMLQLNQWIRENVKRFPGLHLVDSWAALVDPLDANAQPKANTTFDGTHYNGYGASLLGHEVAITVPYLFPNLRTTVSGVSDTYAADPSSNQMIDYPLFIGTSGTPTGTGVSGPVATGWTFALLSGTGTAGCTVTSATNGIGNKQTVAINATTTCLFTLTQTTPSIHTRLAPQDRISLDMWIEMSAQTGLNRFDVYFAQSVSGSTTRYSSTNDDSTVFNPNGWTGRHCTPTQIIGGTPTDFKPGVVIGVTAGGSLTFSASSAQARRKFAA